MTSFDVCQHFRLVFLSEIASFSRLNRRPSGVGRVLSAGFFLFFDVGARLCFTSGMEVESQSGRSRCYTGTNGLGGGKDPGGKAAVRLPAFNRAQASRYARTNHE